MKKNKLIMGLLFVAILTSCQGGTSASDVTSSDSSTSTSEPGTSNSTPREEVVSPTRVFTPWKYEGTYWTNNVDFNLTGSALKDSLRTYMRSRFRGVTYNTVSEMVKLMDKDPEKNGYVISLYDLNSVSISSQNTTWNREHVFPQSKLKDGNENLGAKPGVANVSSDAANIFVADVKLNEARSNNSFLGLNYADKPNDYYPFTIKNTFGTRTDSFNFQGYFNPTQKVRGEIARSQLYMLLMWPDNASISENFSIQTMLKWNLEQPTTLERDAQRNDVLGLSNYQNVRNPFIDHPELACKIWGEENAGSRATCAQK